MICNICFKKSELPFIHALIFIIVILMVFNILFIRVCHRLEKKFIRFCVEPVKAKSQKETPK